MSENKNCQSRSSTDSFLLQLMTQIVEVWVVLNIKHEKQSEITFIK